MATHSSILAWKIPWTEEPDWLQSMWSQTVGHDSVTEHTYTSIWGQLSGYVTCVVKQHPMLRYSQSWLILCCYYLASLHHFWIRLLVISFHTGSHKYGTCLADIRILIQHVSSRANCHTLFWVQEYFAEQGSSFLPSWNVHSSYQEMTIKSSTINHSSIPCLKMKDVKGKKKNKTEPGKRRFSSVQFNCSVVSDSLRPHELQHTRPPCPSSTPGVYSNSCPSSRWCHPAISSSVIPFSSCPQSLPA